jgi:hypothetical protein
MLLGFYFWCHLLGFSLSFLPFGFRRKGVKSQLFPLFCAVPLSSVPPEMQQHIGTHPDNGSIA